MGGDISIDDFLLLMQSGAPYTLLDVRRDDELAAAQYPQPYLHIELAALPARLHDVPRDKPIIVACRSGGRSAQAAAQLQHAGYENVRNLTGGMLAWTEHTASITPNSVARR